jgi:5-methyltetrahydropteroyltriglutamate--homocysteine methyltransferase
MSGALLTTTVGSFPKPAYLQHGRNQYAAGRLSREELAELERRAIREVIALQEELGIDILVDGEMERGDMVAFFAERLDSMKIGGLVRSYGNRYYRKPSIVGKLRWQGPITVEAWRFAQELTDKPVKGMLTGPYTIVEWSFDDYYGDRRRAVLDMAEVIRQEALELEKVGARYMQIDEPAIHTRPEEDLELAIEAVGIVTQGLTSRTVTHICYGEVERIYPDMLRIPVDEVHLAFKNSDFRLLDLFRDRPFTKDLGLGVIDVHNHELETVEEVKAGIRRALELVPPHRVSVSPDCGIKTRTWQEAEAKLRVMMQAVREVKQELGLDGK